MSTQSSQFAYAVGRIRVLDTKLLNSNEVERMLGAKIARDAYRILNETNFASHIGDIEKIESFEEVLKAGLRDTKTLLTKIAPEGPELNILWYSYDIHNIKILLKARLREKPLEEIEEQLMDIGTVPKEIWIDIIYKKEQRELPLPEKNAQKIEEATTEAETLYEKTHTIQIIDLILDKTYWQMAYETAKTSDNDFLQEFVQKSIDIINITAVLRIKFEGREKTLLEKVLMDGGEITIEELLNRFDREAADLAKGTPFDKIVRQGVENFRETHSLFELERLLDNLKIEFIKEAKYIIYGPEPLIAHFWAMTQNAIIIRTIMVGKLNGVSENLIREKLRNLYTAR